MGLAMLFVGSAYGVLAPRTGRALPPRAARGLLLLSWIAGANAASAQEVELQPRNMVSASAPLAPHHWAVSAVERAHGLGLVDAHLPAHRSLTRSQVAFLLAEAARHAPHRAPSLSPLAEAWLTRFREEFPGVRSEGGSGRAMGADGSLSLKHSEHAGRAAPGVGYRGGRSRGRTGATPLADDAAPSVAVSMATAPLPFLAVSGTAVHRSGDLSIPEWELRGEAGTIALAVGRQPVAYGGSRAGGITLSGSAPLERVQLETVRPLRLPLVSRLLGPASVHTFAARLREERHPGDPYVWGMGLSLQPHARLQLAARRVALFGGDSVGAPVTVGTVSRMLLGMTVTNSTNGFENQVASVEARWRVPTEAWLPLTLYGEAGMEDMSLTRAAYKAPGITTGLLLAALPGVPEAAAGVEFTRFGPAPANYGIWYRHFSLHGGWATDAGPLGHPLGGHGSETRVYGNADLLDARLRLKGHAFVRHRGEENLYAPERAGRGTGFGGTAAWRPWRRAEFQATGHRESGMGWREREVKAGISYFF